MTTDLVDSFGANSSTMVNRATIFDKFDDDASGAWEIHEMEDFLASLDEADRKGLGLADARTVFDRLDEDGSGVIDFDEFQTWYLRVFALFICTAVYYMRTVRRV